MTAPIPRPGILDIVAYAPGKIALRPGVTTYKLSSNESGLGPSPKAVSAFEAVGTALHIYPDGSGTVLREKLAAYHHLNADHIICGAGSDELLQLLCKAYLGPDDTALQTAHGFAVYHLATKACGAGMLYAPETDYTTDVDALLAAVEQTTRIVFVANPNNPTGTVIPATQMQRLRDGLRDDILLVVDAAYAEYMEDPAYQDGAAMVEASIASGADNVVMTRTFSKIYGLGGLRLGWAYCPKPVIEVLNRIRGPFNVSSAAIAAGAAAVDDQGFVDKNRDHNRVERARVSERLIDLGFGLVPSSCNFWLVKMRSETEAERQSESKKLCAFLAERGVFVREVAEYGLAEFLRISIGSVEANDAMLALVEEYVT